MAHQLEMFNGEAAHFYVGQTPWHGLGVKLDSPPTIEEGIVAAKLDWQVGMRPLFNEHGKKSTHRETYRMTDGNVFGVVGPGYTPLQNTDAFGWFQPLLDSGEVSLHTAGSLQEGRKVWVLTKVNKPNLEIADGDTVERFVLLSNSHDGTRAVRVGFTPIRVVCANTLRMAHESDAIGNKLAKVLHTKNVMGAIEGLRDMMNVANASFEATAEQYRKLAKFKVSRADMRKYVKLVLDVGKTPDSELPAQTMTKIREILMLADKGKGNDNPAIAGTLWACYNGLTEYLGTSYGRSQDRRIDSLWFGANATLSSKALEIAIAMAS